jgi:hypothetical protein
VRFADAPNTILKFAILLGQFRHHNVCAMGGRTRPVRIEADGLADTELVLTHWRLVAAVFLANHVTSLSLRLVIFFAPRRSGVFAATPMQN